MPFVVPVIHHVSNDLTYKNVHLAREAGCHGVFLINHDATVPDSVLNEPAVAIKLAYPSWFVGTNRLGQSPLEAIRVDAALGLDATWCDAPGMSSSGVDRMGAYTVQAYEEVVGRYPHFKLFASVAFKYQEAEPFPARAAR
ncbi:unnamed protein product, partial [Phaeothamnion confervicola]